MTTLMLAISIPGLTDEDDPDAVADRIVAYLNEAGFAEKRITVSLWPFPQWFGVEAMDEMKALAAELRLRKWGDKAEHTGSLEQDPTSKAAPVSLQDNAAPASDVHGD